MTILTVAELRTFIKTPLVDSALQSLLDATEEDIVKFAGPPGDVTELIDGGYRRLTLNRPASSITSIKETIGLTLTSQITLAPDDYRIRAYGYVLERLGTGTNPRWYWGRLVEVTYAYAGDTAVREMVQVDLVKLELAFSAGVAAETIGSWSISYRSSTAEGSQEDMRNEILSRLNPEPEMRIVGSPSIPLFGESGMDY
jgi:hypothetical protein